MMFSALNFDACGFPLWIVLIALAWVLLLRLKQKDVDCVSPFDRSATLPLRGLLACLVVMGHIRIFAQASGVRIPWMGWETPAVSVFFFLSGYGLAKSFSSRGEKYLQGFLSRSSLKLFVPLLLVVIPYCIRLCLHGDLIPMLRNFLHGGLTPVPNTWFVYALFIVYVFWWMSWRCFRSESVRIVVLWGLIAVYFSVVQFGLNWIFVLGRTIFAFPLGVTTAMHESILQRFVMRNAVRTYCTAILFLLIAVALRSYVQALTMVGRGLVSLLGLFLLLVWYRLPLPRWRIFVWLGGISYELYLVHGVVIVFLLPLLPNHVALFAVIVTTLSTLLAMLLHWMPKWIALRISKRRI